MTISPRNILILDDFDGQDALGAGKLYRGPSAEYSGDEVAPEHADHWMMRGIHPHKASGWTKSGKPLSAAPGSVALPGNPVDGPSRDPADVPLDAPGGSALQALDTSNAKLDAAGSDTSERVDLPAPKKDGDKK